VVDSAVDANSTADVVAVAKFKATDVMAMSGFKAAAANVVVRSSKVAADSGAARNSKVAADSGAASNSKVAVDSGAARSSKVAVVKVVVANVVVRSKVVAASGAVARLLPIKRTEHTGWVAMVGGTYLRLLTATALLAAEAALAMTLLALAPAPSGAQFFEDRFPFQTAGSVDRSTGSNQPRSRSNGSASRSDRLRR